MISKENQYSKIDLYIHDSGEPVSFEKYPQYVHKIKAMGYGKKDSRFEINTKVNYALGAELHLKNFKKVTFTKERETDDNLTKMRFENVVFEIDWMELFEYFNALEYVTINTLNVVKSREESRAEKELKCAIKRALEFHRHIEVIIDEERLEFEEPNAGCTCDCVVL